MSSSHVPALRTYVRALREARPWWPHLGLILVLGLAGAPLALLTPLPLKIVADSVLNDAALPFPVGLLDAEPLVVAVGLAVALVFVNLAHRIGEWLFREWVGERMVARFRAKLFERALMVAAPGQEAAATQDLAFRIMSDAPALQWTAVYAFIPVVVSLVSLGATLWVTTAISPALALTALLTTAPAILLIHVSQKRMRGRWHDVRERESAAQSVVQEVLGALRLVVTFGQERREVQRYEEAYGTAVATKLRALQAQSALGGALSLSTGLGAVVILWIGVREVQAGLLSIGDLLLVIAYVAQLYEPLQQIGTHITGQQQAIASAERAFALLDRAPVVEDSGTMPMDRADGDVSFRNVAFAYPGTDEPVLAGVSLDVPAGSFVGIVGRTGTGKSTLVNLLVRLFDPKEGQILLDGTDLRDLRLSDLRRQFAVVPQDPVLFSTTVFDNIAYAKPGATRAEVIAAAKAAQAHDFIMKLPDGYATPVGDRGARLSGGERQRIALARAFLKDAPILILDEPTSAIDTATEGAIVESLERLVRGRTTFMIAHRLSTLRRVDFVLRVENGRLAVEPPPHPAPALAAAA